MGAVQVTTQNDTLDLYLSGEAITKDQETLLTDAGRTTDLLFGTVMAKVAASQKWVPLASLTTTTGASVAQGIFVGSTVLAATIAAGDVVDQPILVGGQGLVVDENLVVLDDEGTPLTLDSVFSSSDATNVYYKVTVRDQLAQRGIFIGETISITGQQS